MAPINHHRLATLALLFPLLRLALSQTLDVKPTIDNMTMHGPGCPIGGAGIVREFHDNTPVMLFPDWGLSVPAPAGDEEAVSDSESKFCAEEITLGGIPAGKMGRLTSVTVSGWAELQSGSSLGLEVETRFGELNMGSGSSTVQAADLKSNVFTTTLTIKPEVWSPCVDSSGKLPKIVIQTTLSLNGTKAADGKVSGGTVGGAKNDMKKALTIHFQPEWKSC